MSSASLSRDWELEGGQTNFSISDDDLESLPTSAAASELGDDPWDDDNEPEHVASSPKIVPYESAASSSDITKHTPLDEAEALNNDEGDDESQLASSGIQESEDSSTNSTFSFHFPDPLEASRHFDTYAQLSEIPGESEVPESDVETDSVTGTDILSGDDTKEPHTTSSSLKPLPATPPKPPKPEVIGDSSPISEKRRSKIFLKRRLEVGIIVFVVCLVVALWTFRSQPVPTPLISPIIPSIRSIPSTPTDIERLVETPTVRSAAVHPDGTVIRPTPALIDGKEQPPTLGGRPPRLMLEAPPSSGFFIGSFDFSEPPVRTTALSFNPVSRITSSISTTFHSFSRVVLNDLRDVLDLIDELLIFIRGHIPVETIQQHSQSLLDYLAEKVAHRHEHAKRNARIFTAKTMALAKVASAELALRQETVLENAKCLWNGVKKWRR